MDKGRLIAEVERETGIRLDVADPLMAAAVINERMLDATLTDLRKVIAATGDNWATISARNEASAKAAASALINDAGKWVTAQFKEAATEAAAAMLIELRAETVKVEKAARIAVLAAWASGIIGAVALAAIFGFGIAGL